MGVRNSEEKLNIALKKLLANEDLFHRAVFRTQKINNVKTNYKATVVKNDNYIYKPIARIAKMLRLDFEDDAKTRLHILIGYLIWKKYSKNTVIKYLSEARKMNLIGDNSLTILPIVDKDGTRQHRFLSNTIFKQFIAYIFANISKTTIPFIFAFNTGLRTKEILQISTETLFEIKNMHDTISSITVKSTVAKNIKWKPIYTDDLVKFINLLIEVYYKEEYMLFIEKNIIIKLFPMNPQTLNYRLKSLFRIATGIEPPLGLGVHMFRYSIASKIMEDTDNILLVKDWLGHKNSKTSLRYVKRLNDEKISKTLDETFRKHHLV